MCLQVVWRFFCYGGTVERNILSTHSGEIKDGQIRHVDKLLVDICCFDVCVKCKCVLVWFGLSPFGLFSELVYGVRRL